MQSRLLFLVAQGKKVQAYGYCKWATDQQPWLIIHNER